MPEGEDKAPDKLLDETVVKGDGKKITEKSTVLTNFTAKLWKDGKQLDDTWRQGGPQEIPVATIPGWAEALEGQEGRQPRGDLRAEGRVPQGAAAEAVRVRRRLLGGRTEREAEHRPA